MMHVWRESDLLQFTLYDNWSFQWELHNTHTHTHTQHLITSHWPWIIHRTKSEIFCIFHPHRWYLKWEKHSKAPIITNSASLDCFCGKPPSGGETVSTSPYCHLPKSSSTSQNPKPSGLVEDKTWMVMPWLVSLSLSQNISRSGSAWVPMVLPEQARTTDTVTQIW